MTTFSNCILKVLVLFQVLVKGIAVIADINVKGIHGHPLRVVELLYSEKSICCESKCYGITKVIRKHSLGTMSLRERFCVCS